MSQPVGSHHHQLEVISATMATWLTEPCPTDPGWAPSQWQMFKKVCRVHGVAPLLHEKLRQAAWLEPDLKAWLAEQYQFNARRLAKMHQELDDILRLFQQNSVPVMPLKGSVLSANVYKNPAWRPMADLDILVRPDDFERSTNLLKQLGYEPEVAHWKHTEFIKPDNRTVVSKTVEHPDNPRGVELHRYCRETFAGPTVDLTGVMWDSAQFGPLRGQSVMLASPELLWLHLVIHATYHAWQGRGRLIHLVDLAYLTPQLGSLQPLLERVGARFTYPALKLLDKYFPAILEPTILANQQQRTSASFRKWVTALDLVNTSYLNPEPAGLYFFKALRFSEGRPRDVAQALRFAFLPSLEEIALDHPSLATSKMAWLGYFLLPFDWIRRLVGKAS